MTTKHFENLPFKRSDRVLVCVTALVWDDCEAEVNSWVEDRLAEAEEEDSKWSSYWDYKGEDGFEVGEPS